MDSIERDLKDLVRITEEAGALLMTGFRGDHGAREKTRGDLVTELDERCEAQLRERLGDRFPHARVVGEEEGGVPEGLTFYVDPLDGTNNYAHGHPWFCVSVGLWDESEPVMGVVHAPAMGLTYSAAVGRGLLRNGEPGSVSTTEELRKSLMATGFDSAPWRQPENNYRAFVHLDALSHGVRRCAAAALEIAMVAEGAYDGFWDQGLAAWDLAAGAILVREAGGCVSDLDGGPFSIHAGRVLATNGHIHEELRDALAHARALPPIREVP